MKNFCKDLKDQAMKIINYEQKEMIPLTNKEKKSYEKQKVCYICKKEFCTDKNDKSKFKLYKKVRDHCHLTGKFRGAAHCICNLCYKIPKEIPVVFHDGSMCDYHFTIKQLAKEFKGDFECLGGNTKKYITFSAQIYKETENGKTVTYKLKFIDSFRFMSASLSSLVDNLSEINKKESINESINELIKKFPNTYRFCQRDLNKFTLLLRKGVYPYEYMDSWEKFKEKSLPDKESFHSKLNKEDITNEDYAHAQKV